MTGGGYGSVIVGGQILSGVSSRKTVGITTLSEGLVSIVGVLGYVFMSKGLYLNWSLILSLMVGSLVSIPLGVYVVKKLHPKKIKLGIAVVSIILGTAVLSGLFL